MNSRSNGLGWNVYGDAPRPVPLEQKREKTTRKQPLEMIIMNTGILALIIFSAILLQIAVAVLISFFRRQRQYQELSNENHQIATTAITPETETIASNLAWEGFREFIVQRRVFEDNNRSICSFYLIPSDGKPLPTFLPGQFLTFKLVIKDTKTNDSKNVIRCYSLSDAPQSDYYRVSIKRVPAGLSSNFFHDNVDENARLWVKAPSGHFHLMQDDALPIVLIGGGIGITPMLSILNTVLESEIKREIWLYYGVRNGDEQIMKTHLQTLAQQHHHFHLHVCYSAPNGDDIEGIDYQHRGRVTVALLRATLKLMRYQFYVCGPKPLMESLIPELEAWGVDSGDIYYESFGPASLIKHEKKPSMLTQPITVTFSKSGKNIVWDASADSLLEFAETNGIEIESACRAGSCGSCQTAINAGEVEYNQEPDATVLQGHCLLCISTPKTNLTLDA